MVFDFWDGGTSVSIFVAVYRDDCGGLWVGILDCGVGTVAALAHCLGGFFREGFWAHWLCMVGCHGSIAVVSRLDDCVE